MMFYHMIEQYLYNKVTQKLSLKQLAFYYTWQFLCQGRAQRGNSSAARGADFDWGHSVVPVGHRLVWRVWLGFTHRSGTLVGMAWRLGSLAWQYEGCGASPKAAQGSQGRVPGDRSGKAGNWKHHFHHNVPDKPVTEPTSGEGGGLPLWSRGVLKDLRPSFTCHMWI